LDLKSVECPNHEIKCPTNTNDFTEGYCIATLLIEVKCDLTPEFGDGRTLNTVLLVNSEFIFSLHWVPPTLFLEAFIFIILETYFVFQLNIDLIKLLVEHGATVTSHKTDDGRTILHHMADLCMGADLANILTILTTQVG